MKNLNKNRCVIMFFTIAILLGNCAKNESTLTIQKAASTEQIVATPFGAMAKGSINLIEPGNALKIEDGRIVEYEVSSGKVVKDLGPHVKRTSTESIPTGRTSGNDPGTSGNYIAALNANSTPSNMTYFSSTFTVPVAPTQVNAETLFYGNYLFCDAGSLYTSLQYGGSAAGGGENWALVNWFYANSGSLSFSSLIQNISPGTSLQSVISGSSGTWTASFAGYGNGLQVSGINPYGPQSCITYFSGYPASAKAYPADYGLDFTNVQIKVGNTLTSGINWGVPTMSPSGTSMYASLQTPLTCLDPGNINDCNPCVLSLNYANTWTPSNVTFPNGGAYPISLSWTAPAAGATSYDIGYTVQLANGSLVHGTGTSTTTSYTFPFTSGQYCSNTLAADVRAHYPSMETMWSPCQYSNPQSVTIGTYTPGTTLTFQYASGAFTVSSDHPVGDNLTIGGFVAGYTGTSCTGGLVDSDSFSSTLNACNNFYTVTTNGLSCIDKRYKFSYATVNGTNYGNGATVVVNGHSYKILIIGSTCSVYPC